MAVASTSKAMLRQVTSPGGSPLWNLAALPRRHFGATTSVAAVGKKPSSSPTGPRQAQKAVRKKVKEGPGAAGGVDPGHLIKPEDIRPPPDLSDVPVLQGDNVSAANAGRLFRYSPGFISTTQKTLVPRLIAAEWAASGQPSTVLRRAYLELWDVLSASASGSGSSAIALTGKPGSGKSTAMLHAVNLALQNDWVVLYIPDAISLIDGHHGYTYSTATETYHQNDLSASVLSSLLATSPQLGQMALPSNIPTLSGVVDDQVIESRPPSDAKATLADLARRGIDEPAFAPAVLENILAALAKQDTYPVLLAIDSAQALYRPTKYQDASFNRLDSFALSLPRQLLEFTSARKKLSRGATLLAASSTQSDYQSLAYNLALQGQSPDGVIWPGWAAYGELAKPLANHKQLEIPALVREEAAALIVGLQRTRELFGALEDQAFLRHLMASEGNAREFKREVRSNVV